MSNRCYTERVKCFDSVQQRLTLSLSKELFGGVDKSTNVGQVKNLSYIVRPR